MIKKIAFVFAGLIVILAVGGYFLMSNLDGIVKRAVEKYASAATQSDVRLDSVKLLLSSGDGTLSGLSIGNPKGFTTPHAFYLGSIEVKIDTNTIRGTGPIVINDITIDKPQVTYELLNNGDSNIHAIQKNTQAYAGSFQGKSGGSEESEATPEPTPAPAVGDSGRKIIIKNLTVRSGQVAISQEMLGGKQLSATLPEIHLTDIGKASGGATAAQVAQQIISSISNAAAQSAVTELAKEKIGGVLKAVPAGAIGGSAVDAVGDKVKGIFGQ